MDVQKRALSNQYNLPPGAGAIILAAAETILEGAETILEATDVDTAVDLKTKGELGIPLQIQHKIKNLFGFLAQLKELYT